jgi:hypothetical protein
VCVCVCVYVGQKMKKKRGNKMWGGGCLKIVIHKRDDNSIAFATNPLGSRANNERAISRSRAP